MAADHSAKWILVFGTVMGCTGGGADSTGSASASATATATEATTGPSSTDTTDPGPTTGPTTTTTTTTGGPTTDDPTGPGTGVTTDDTGELPPALGGPFRRGINLGYNPGWGDPDMAYLAVEAGSTSARLKLSENHFDNWGYGIETGDMMQYAALGMSDHVAFLVEPIAAHSTAPPDVEAWQLAYYIPTNLYAPAIVNGAINPENYWAHYVYQTVDTYKEWVNIWEVWNEPDWTSDWQVTQTWATDPPLKEHLPRFGGSIFDYVRMLRVTMEAARLADPDARIALGGLGYPTFLAALLRYTDNPDNGAVTPEFPDTGAAYFDVLNIHYYPLWTPGSSDAGVDGFMKLRDQFAAAMTAAGAAPRPFNATEIGAPRESVMGSPGGEAYARNFYIKSMVRAHAEGFLGLDWFILSDADDSDNAFGKMGLYHDVKGLPAKEDAVRTPTGVAARTLGTLLAGAVADPAGTGALALPEGVRGAAFRLPDDRRAVVLWAFAAGPDEDAAAAYSLVTDVGFSAHAWDHSATNTSTPLLPEAGAIALDLGADPVILLED